MKKKNFFSGWILIFLLISCSQKETVENRTILLLDKKNSFIELEGFAFDRMEIVKEDSTWIYSFYEDGFYFLNVFFEKDHALYEKRERGWKADEVLGIDSILIFSLRDTVFIYDSAVDLPVVVPSLSIADCKYRIFKQDNYHVTVKQSLIDTTYQEMFFYDEDFNIFKFINTFQENICIYKAAE
ncbi:MAG: hypothetical protein LUG18_05600 [Candidatus Azobacteroides sp.]|nr:hypothetical protein [Candidatus Azobacteroides sp.]